MSFRYFFAFIAVFLLTACENNTNVTQQMQNTTFVSSASSIVVDVSSNSSSTTDVSNASEENKTGWLTYHDDRFGFSMRYPEFVYDLANKKRKFEIKKTPDGIAYGFWTHDNSAIELLIMGRAETDQDILSFINTVQSPSSLRPLFGTGCRFEKISGKENYDLIKVISNGKDITDPKMTCITNFAYKIIYHNKKIALFYFGQEYLFSDDGKISNSFEFDE